MFSPIIHNLPEWHPAYEACQNYNALIANKPKGVDMTLDQKIEAQRLWKVQCHDRAQRIADRGIAMKWIYIANAVGAAANCYFWGATGDHVNAAIGMFNIVIVVFYIFDNERSHGF